MSNPNIKKIDSGEITVAPNTNHYSSDGKITNNMISGDTKILKKNEIDERTFSEMQQRSTQRNTSNTNQRRSSESRQPQSQGRSRQSGVSSAQRYSSGSPHQRRDDQVRQDRPNNREYASQRNRARRTARKKKKLMPVIIVIAAVVVIGIIILIVGKTTLSGVESPIPFVSSYLASISKPAENPTDDAAVSDETTASDGTLDAITENIDVENVLISLDNYKLDENYSTFFATATITGTADCVNLDKLAEGLGAEMNTALAEIVDAAKRASDVYNEDDTYKESAINTAFSIVMGNRLNDSSYYDNKKITIKAKYDNGTWQIVETSPFASEEELNTAQEKMISNVSSELVYHEKQYNVPESSPSGYIPDQSCYGITSDPNVVMDIINSKAAQKLLKGQTMAFNAGIPFISEINYYFDESILAVVWQEWYDGVVATYSECVLADGSQIKKKTEGDTVWGGLDVATNLAAQANAVYAVGGDFYNHDRSCGIVVINREIYRFEPYTADTCFVTAGGDMLFVKRGEFTDQSQAQQFIEENDVVFSLAFGPVLIENGQDVTPDYYQWGEINDTYARSAIGMLGNLHYLTVNLNNEPLATLRQATNAMLRYGCTKAYTLDGGQTACTIINGRLINPVQFGFERVVSDILFFATAVRN